MKNNKLFRVFSLFGLIGVTFYFLHVIFGSLFYEGYNSMAQAISDLTAKDSPSKYIAMPFSMIYGIFTVIFSTYFFVYFKQKINKYVTLGAGFFCIMNFISFFGYTFFPLSEAGYAETFQDKMHMVVTVLIVIFTIISLVLLTIGFFKTDNDKIIGIISLCAFILLLAGAMLINILPKEFFGIAERINVYTVVVYTGILSLWLYGYVRLNK